MLKRMLATFTAVAAGLAVVGVAWAGGGDDDLAAGATTDVSTGATIATTGESVATTGATASSSTEATVAASTPTTLDSTTSTSVDDRGGDGEGDDDATTSTSVAATTSTSLDDNDDRVGVPDGITTHVVPGVGTVTISVFQGNLTLVSVVTSWQIEEQRVESDRIEIEFVSGEAEAEFEARVEDGGVQVRIETD